MFVSPFSAHSYIGFEKELSHATLAQGELASLSAARVVLRYRERDAAHDSRVL